MAVCNHRPVLWFSGFSTVQSKDVLPVVGISLVPPVLVAIVATVAFYFYRIRCPDKPGRPAPLDWHTKRSPELYKALELPHEGAGCRTEGGAGGGSGPGVDQKNPEAELLPIKLDTLVGKGRFAEVWRARLLQGQKGGADSYETVAVKVFPVVEYTSWRNECSIFSETTLQHDNVIQFLASEERGPPGKTYWLVLAYYSLGNLQEYLIANTLSWEELLHMAGSIAKGLAHLHCDTTCDGEPKVNHLQPVITDQGDKKGAVTVQHS